MELQPRADSPARRKRKTRWILALALVSAFVHGMYGATPTTTSLSSSQTSSTFGQPITITAQVAPNAATGKVTFFDGVTIIGTATLSGGQATLTTTTLASGVRLLGARYSGDSVYAPGTSQPFRQTVKTLGAAAFQVSAYYPVGQGPRCIATADFNGDGKVDLAVANESDNTLSVLLGNGKGGFSPEGTYNVGSDPWFVVTGDFNGDGNVDIVVVSTLDNGKTAQPGELNVLLGNGDGTFQPPAEFPTGSLSRLSGLLPIQATVADFNSDGIADIAVAANGSGDLDLQFGNGDGTFGNLTTYELFRPVAVTAGDFNGDGIADLAASNSYDGNVYLYLGKGNGTFQSPVLYPAGVDSGFLTAGDLNGDGKQDLIMAGDYSGVIYVWLGNGDGTFQGSRTFTVGKAPASIAITDFNGDGIPDLVVANAFSYSLSLLVGKGDGTFQPATTFTNNNFFVPESVVAGDFNGDGIPDFAIANSGFNQVIVVLGVASMSPDLTISKSHSGTFSQGQAGATYTITASNTGLAATTAPVSVVDTLPAGLTATAIAGTGWSCTLASLKCTRSDVLAANAAYPAITVTVSVAANAPLSLTNTATVSGGGESDTGNDTVGDVTAIRQSNAVVSVPATVNVSVAAGSSSSQQISLSSTVSGIPWTAAVSANWLTVNPTSGTAPATITLAVATTSLSPGNYTGTITISNPLAASSQETVTVKLTVIPTGATVSVSPAVLSFQIQQGAQDQFQSLQIGGASSTPWQASATTSGGGSWLNISPGSGTIPAFLTVFVNSTSSLPGNYQGSITVVAPGATPSSITIPVTLTVTPPAATDVIESLVFTGKATCTDSFCSGFGNGAITGAYSLDITTGNVLAGWSFVAPFGTISSNQSGASTSVYTGSFGGDLSQVFQVSNPSYLADISFFFPGTDTGQIGPLAANVGSGACINIPGGEMGGPACEPDYLITGSTALAVPSITPGRIVPIYSNANTIQPGEWVSIFGTNLAAATAIWNGSFTTSLGGTSVTINGKAAYPIYVSPTQINVQAPSDTATGPVSVVVATAGGSATSTVTLAQFGPSFCLLDTSHVTGIILRPNGSGSQGGGTYDILGPTGNSLGYPTVAAKAGDTVELFAVGLGPTNPSVTAGQAFSGAAPTSNSVSLSINKTNVIPTFAGISSAGLYQINLVVPAGLGTGDVPLIATVGGVQTPTGVVISLQ